MKMFASVAAASLLLAGAAFAQTSTAPAPNRPATNNSTSNNASSTNAPAQTVQIKQMLSSDVVNSAVYDPGENKIGTIDNLVLSPGGEPEQAVIGVGGFLGVGEKDVTVPFTDLKVKERNGKRWFELARSKDELKSAPAFDTKAHKM